MALVDGFCWVVCGYLGVMLMQSCCHSYGIQHFFCCRKGIDEIGLLRLVMCDKPRIWGVMHTHKLGKEESWSAAPFVTALQIEKWLADI